MLNLTEELKKITTKNDETLREDMQECDTCGQISRLRNGFCDWCQKVYESNK